MEYKEFLNRQGEFVGKKMETTIKWKDGTIHRLRRRVPNIPMDEIEITENYAIVNVKIL